MRKYWPAVLALGIMVATAALAGDEPLRIHLPLQRRVYQTNETIDVVVLRNSDKKLDEEALSLLLVGDDGSSVDCSYATPKGRTSFAQHLLLNGRALRPGAYTLKASCGGDTAEVKLEVYSHIRQSSFKTVMWSS